MIKKSKIPAKAAGPDDVAHHESEPNFDYALAAENSAFRWLEIARGYERLGLLND